jgi:hypothetical protein
LTLRPRQFALVNGIIVLAWLMLAWQVGRQYTVRSEAARQPTAV